MAGKIKGALVELMGFQEGIAHTFSSKFMHRGKHRNQLSSIGVHDTFPVLKLDREKMRLDFAVTLAADPRNRKHKQ